MCLVVDVTWITLEKGTIFWIESHKIVMMSILATKFNLGTVGGGALVSFVVVVVVNFVSCSPSDGEHWEAG